MFRKKKHISFATSLFYRFTTPKKHSAMLCFFGVVNPRTISLLYFLRKYKSSLPTTQSFGEWSETTFSRAKVTVRINCSNENSAPSPRESNKIRLSENEKAKHCPFAYGAKQKFFVKLLYTKVCGFPKGKALGTPQCAEPCAKKKVSSSKLPLFCIG